MAERTVVSLEQIMREIGGPNAGKRKLYATIIDSMVLYGVPVWTEALSFAKTRHSLQKLQRRQAFRSASVSSRHTGQLWRKWCL